MTYNFDQAPKHTQKLPGSLWCITTYFNPGQLHNKLENYYTFRERLLKQQVSLLTVECALKGAPFELKPISADKLLQVRSDSVLWHKERLLNIALANLPEDCDKVVWADADVIFVNNSWPDIVSQFLEDYEIVKPFDTAIRISKKQHRLLVSGKFSENEIMSTLNKDNVTYEPNKGMLNYLSVFAVAARKKTMSSLKFYDKAVLSNADTLMASAFINSDPPTPIGDSSHKLPSDYLNDFYPWKKKAWQNIEGSITFCPGTLLHLFHGEYKNRRYNDQLSILAKHNYKLGDFLVDNNDGCLEWTKEGREIEKDLIKYFKERNEASSFSVDFLILLKKIRSIIKKLT